MEQMIQQIQVWDEKTILRIISRRGGSLTQFMKVISSIGDGYVWAITAIIFFFTSSTPLSWLFTGMCAFAVELVLYKIIKQSTTRQRPFKMNPSIQNLVIPQDEYSFPSGHTAAATVAALLFSVALPVLSPIFFTLAVLIGLSRVYLGVHYPSDVFMGFALGSLSFTAAYFLLL